MPQSLTGVIYGGFLELLPTTDEYLIINFSPTSGDRKKHWRNNGISADFLGDYFSSFFPNLRELETMF